MEARNEIRGLLKKDAHPYDRWFVLRDVQDPYSDGLGKGVPSHSRFTELRTEKPMVNRGL